jgi:DNA-binding transcriptional LysR family regulator
MKMTQLRYFFTLAKVKNFTKAAASLYITQPSLSQSISQLEKELNTVLFKRSTVKVELTYTGELLCKAAQNILYLYDDVTNQINAVENLDLGTLSIGVPYAYTNLVMPPVIQTFTRRHPKVKTSVTEGRSAQLVVSFLENKLDLIFLDSDMLKEMPNLNQYQCEEIIKDDPLVFTIPPNHALCRLPIEQPQVKQNLPKLTISDLIDSQFVMLQPHHRLRRKLDLFFESVNFVPDVILEANQLESSLYNAVYAKAVTVVPYSIFSRFKDSNKGYAFLCKEQSFISSLYCIYSTNSSCFGVAREFAKTAKSILLTENK